MKIIAKQSIEQGLSKKLGGTFKLRAGAEYEAQQGDAGAVVSVNGKQHTIPQTILEKMVSLGYVEVA